MHLHGLIFGLQNVHGYLDYKKIANSSKLPTICIHHVISYIQLVKSRNSSQQRYVYIYIYIYIYSTNGREHCIKNKQYSTSVVMKGIPVKQVLVLSALKD